MQYLNTDCPHVCRACVDGFGMLKCKNCARREEMMQGKQDLNLRNYLKRRTIMQSEKSDALKYRARVYTDNALIPKIEEDLRVMVYALIGDKKLEITQERGGYDVYPSCKDSLKEYCPAKKKRYQACLPDHALCWYGDSHIELYCHIIASIAGNGVYTPFSSIPRAVSDEEE